MKSVLALCYRILRPYRQLRRRYKVILWGSILVILLLLQPGLLSLSRLGNKATGSSAQLYFTLPDGPPSGNQSFTVELRLKTGSTPVNAVQIHLNLDPRDLEILNMSTTSSFCSFYPENSFDTIKGTVDLACGTPSPGFVGDSPIIILTLRARVTGTTTLTADPSQTEVLANDGRGTNLLSSAPRLEIVLKQTL